MNWISTNDDLPPAGMNCLLYCYHRSNTWSEEALYITEGVFAPSKGWMPKLTSLCLDHVLFWIPVASFNLTENVIKQRIEEEFPAVF